MKNLWDKYKAEIGIAVLVIYVLCLGVATADEVFRLGLFPPKLDRMIAESIDRFEGGGEDSTKAYTEIVQYGDFAAPQLVDALDREGRVRALSMRALKEITDQKFTKPDEWREWYGKHQKDFE